MNIYHTTTDSDQINANSLILGDSYYTLKDCPSTSRLLGDALPIWQEFHRHPFVQGIGDGSLDLEKFQFYLIQDYLYLLDYARVFALGVVKAKTPALMQLFESSIHIILDEELTVHKDYMRRLGINEDRANSTRRALANNSYTSYMLDVAMRGGETEILSAILSCALSYEEIAHRLVNDNPGCLTHQFYGEWIRAYASPEYHEDNLKRLSFFESLTKNSSPSELTYLSEVFSNCSRYELAFWQMGWLKEY